MKTGVIIAISVLALVVVVLIIFLAMRSKPQSSDAALPLAVVPAEPSECIPYSQAQQNAEKTRLRSKCVSKLLIPFVGQVQYYSCMKQIPTQLTPVKNC